MIRKAAEKLVESATQKWDAGLVTSDDIEKTKQEYEQTFLFNPFRFIVHTIFI